MSEPAPSGALYDEWLVTLVQSGDRGAAEQLFRRWNPRMLRTARRYVGDADLAEQIVQESWIGVLKGIRRLRDPSRLAPWIFGILRRKGADSIRIAQRDRAYRNDPAPPEPSERATQDDAAAIRSAFASLPPDQRLAAHCHFVEGLTLREIAEVQGIPLGTAKTRLFHARRKLKEALGGGTKGENHD